MSRRENVVPTIVSQYLTASGDGEGTIDALADYSGTATDFYIAPPPDQTYAIRRMIVLIRDTAINADDYGAITGGLTNGVRIRVRNNERVLYHLDGKNAVKDNSDWAGLCYDATALEWGPGDEMLVVRWTFGKSGRNVEVRGDGVNSVATDGERLVVTFNDNLGALIAHRFLVQGYIA